MDMPGTVLIVDDDAGVRDTVRLALTREGYGVLTAPDGEAAIRLMAMDDQARSVSVLLCDLEMPHGRGTEVIHHFSARFPAIPIIVMSGASDTAFLDGIVQPGVADWLRKPVTREALVEKIRTASNLYTLRQQQR
jgi:DNA-binding NtrC family response regulator